jgi:putative ABC transport system permease protein
MTVLSLTLAARNLTRHRVRTLISLSAIAFGVAALLVAGGFIEWIFWAMRESTVETGLGHVHVSRPGFRDAGLADPRAYLLPSDPKYLAVVRSTPGIRALDQRLSVSGLVAHGSTTVGFTGQAVDPEPNRQISRGLTLNGEGLSATNPRGVLLGRGLAAALGVRRGDIVSFLVRLPSGGINGTEGTVVGIFDTHVKSFDDTAVRLPLTMGRELLRTQSADTWVLRLDTIEAAPAAVEYLRSALPHDQFDVASWFDISDFYRKAVVLLSNQIDVVGILVAFIIVLGISNTLMMNVMERTGEIGTMMALGTPRASIIRLFMLEGVLLGVVGAVLGLLAGFALAQVLSAIGIPMPPPPGRDEAYSAEIILTVRLALVAFSGAIIATALASVYPAWRASCRPVVDALRHNR